MFTILPGEPRPKNCYIYHIQPPTGTEGLKKWKALVRKQTIPEMPPLEMEGASAFGDTYSLVYLSFFTRRNVENLENLLRYLVYSYAGYKIAPQDRRALALIMKDVYNDQVEPIDEIRVNPTVLNKQIALEVTKFNKAVCRILVPYLISEAKHRLVYLNYKPQPLPDRGFNTTRYDSPDLTQLLIDVLPQKT